MEVLRTPSLESGMIYSFTLLVWLIGLGIGGINHISHSDAGRQFDYVIQNIIMGLVAQSSVSTNDCLVDSAFSPSVFGKQGHCSDCTPTSYSPRRTEHRLLIYWSHPYVKTNRDSTGVYECELQSVSVSGHETSEHGEARRSCLISDLVIDAECSF